MTYDQDPRGQPGSSTQPQQPHAQSGAHPGSEPGQPGANPQQPAGPPPKTSGLAITALVLSLLFFLPLVPLIGGILGIVATVRISGQRHALGGYRLAVAAIPIGFLVFLVVSSITVPAFIKYTRKAKTIEAIEGLERIKAGARSYFQQEHYTMDGNLLPRRFPVGDTGWVPSTPCCQGPGKKCAPAPQQWNVEPWRSLRFAQSEPHYFQWRYRSTGEFRKAKFTVEARADLDCDGVYSNYRIDGHVGDDWGELAIIIRRPIITNAIE